MNFLNAIWVSLINKFAITTFLDEVTEAQPREGSAIESVTVYVDLVYFLKLM